ncbi:defensin-like protein 269 [Brassica rapa]|uniref:defensin-like protein 269 n=1 Tax=Brassica campestris TaxID=3711 RepID=UPI0008724950|nr:defensin-like protein 269 [Brassica rapa]
MTVSKTTLLIVQVALLSCVCISNARELMKPGRYVQDCARASCQPKLAQPNQYFGSCFKNSDCKNSCFDSCKFQKCTNHQCDCGEC